MHTDALVANAYDSRYITSALFNMKTVFPVIGIYIINIRRSWDRLIFIMDIPILVKRHVYIEPGPDEWWTKYLCIFGLSYD